MLLVVKFLSNQKVKTKLKPYTTHSILDNIQSHTRLAHSQINKSIGSFCDSCLNVPYTVLNYKYYNLLFLNIFVLVIT